MSTATARGHFVSWDGGCLLIGHAPTIAPMHSHYAIQIAFGSEHGIRFRPSERESWTSYDGVVISSRQPHSMDASAVPFSAVILVEPETREGRALRQRFELEGITSLTKDDLAPIGPALFSAWQDERSVDAVTSAAQGVIRSLTGGVEPSVASDERILRAMAYIRSHIDAPITLEEVADVACLSPSRFRHLFVEETGMALRPYILWRRFVRVWELMTTGTSLSAAAHAAGFADAAHLTRTSRRTFGFAPSILQFSAPLKGAEAGVSVGVGKG